MSLYADHHSYKEKTMYNFLDRHNLPRPSFIDGVLLAILGMFAIRKIRKS